MSIQTVQSVMALSRLNAQATEIKYFPSNIGAHGLLMIFSEYKFQPPGSRGLLVSPNDSSSLQKNIKGSVLLPIPSLIDGNNMRLSPFEFGTNIGSEEIATIVSRGSGENIAKEMKSQYDRAYNKITSGKVSANDALFLLRKLEDENFITNAISQGIGTTINPKTSLTFEGMNLKDFTFEWSLAPTQETDSFMIRDIIKLIKQNILPTYGTAGFTARGMLNYPSTVDIYLLGVDTDYFMQFKTAMVGNMTVNYTPNGLSILRGGRPASIDLSISFTEMDIHTADDYGGTTSGSLGDMTLDYGSYIKGTFDTFMKDIGF